MPQKIKADTDRKSKLEKLLFCENQNCSQHLKFTITEFDLSLKDTRKRIFKSRCQMCHSTVMITGEQYYYYERYFGTAALTVISNNYDDLFE